jgi:hypothetical protein
MNYTDLQEIFKPMDHKSAIVYYFVAGFGSSIVEGGMALKGYAI